MNKKNKITLIILFVVLVGGSVLMIFNNINSKKYRVGIITGLDYFRPMEESLISSMKENGYIEGKNIDYYIVRTNFEPEKEKVAINNMIAKKVDLIVSAPTEVSLLAKESTKDKNIPMVFMGAMTEKVGLINSINNPGENISGVRFPAPELAIKRLDIMLDIVPDIKTILIPYQRGYPNVEPQLEVLRPILKEKGISLVEAPADNGKEIQRILDDLDNKNAKIDAILAISEPLLSPLDNSLIIAKYSKKYNTPFGGSLISNKENGALFNVNINQKTTGQQTAAIVSKILKGMNTEDIPVISSDSYIQINNKEITRMGLKISESILGQADEIIN